TGWRGKAPTVDWTGWPSWTAPMSVSLTEAQICIRLRSLAIRNRLGALRLATTVWPMLTRRSRITPLTGDRIVVYRRFAVASSRLARATAALLRQTETAAFETS